MKGTRMLELRIAISYPRRMAPIPSGIPGT